MNAGAFANWVPRIPTIQRDLNLDDAELGVALLGAAGGQIAMMPVAAWLVARMGSRRTAAGAAVVSSLVIVLPAAASSLLALAGALVVVGAAGAVLDVAMNAQGIAVERRAARPTLPYFHAVFSLGSVVGAGMGTAAAALGVAPQPHLLVAGGLFAALAVATRGGLMADAEPSARAPGRARPDRYLLSLGLLACFALLVEGSVTDWSAVFLRNELHASAGASGTGYIAFSVAMFVGAVAAPRLVTRHSPASLLRVGGLLTTASMLLVVFGQTVPLAVLGFAGIGVALSCSFPLILSAAGAHPTIPVGASVATVSMMGYTGFVAGPPAHRVRLSSDVAFVRARSGRPARTRAVRRLEGRQARSCRGRRTALRSNASGVGRVARGCAQRGLSARNATCSAYHGHPRQSAAIRAPVAENVADCRRFWRISEPTKPHR